MARGLRGRAQRRGVKVPREFREGAKGTPLPRAVCGDGRAHVAAQHANRVPAMPVPPIPDGYSGITRASHPTQETFVAFLKALVSDLESGAAVLDGNEIEVLYHLGSEEMWGDAGHTTKVVVGEVNLDTGERVVRLQATYHRPALAQA